MLKITVCSFLILLASDAGAQNSRKSFFYIDAQIGTAIPVSTFAEKEYKPLPIVAEPNGLAASIDKNKQVLRGNFVLVR